MRRLGSSLSTLVTECLDAIALDWTPIVTVTNSIRDIPIQIDGGDEANIQHAIKAVHDEIFQDWPPTEDEIAEFIRGQLPDES